MVRFSLYRYKRNVMKEMALLTDMQLALVPVSDVQHNNVINESAGGMIIEINKIRRIGYSICAALASTRPIYRPRPNEPILHFKKGQYNG